MNRKPGFGWFALAVLVACWLPGGATAAPVEQRCAELGAVCLCSEPLRFASAGTLREDVDPPDSEGPGAKECAGGGALDAEPNGIQLVSVVDNASGVDFPGPNPPSFVLKMTSVANDGDNGWQVRGNLPTGVRNETICGRTYQRFGNDLRMVNDPMRAKLAEAIIGGTLIQHQIMHDGTGRLDTFSGDCTGTINMQAAGRQSWLRHEVCLDVGTNSVASRTRLTVVDTGATDTVSCGPYSIATPASFSNFLIGNLFLQTDGNSAYFGSRYVTHAIQTRMPLDRTFWPGPASELEGSGGSSPPPPPATGDPLGKPGQPTYVQ